MSDRTHLDEIVEEELHHIVAGKGTRDAFYRVAERAFRHALEQIRRRADLLDTIRPAPADKVVPQISPAPAKEKACCPWGTPGTPCVHHSPTLFGKSTAASPDTRDGLPLRYDWKYMGGPLITNDRRRGERRKYSEIRAGFFYSLNTITEGGVLSSSGLERRSGSDRRSLR